MRGSSLLVIALAGALSLTGSSAALADAPAVPVVAFAQEDRPVAGSPACDVAVNGDAKVRETEADLAMARDRAAIDARFRLVVELLEQRLRERRRDATERLCVPASTGGPITGTAATVRGGGTLSVRGQRYSLAVDARTTTTGRASGRFGLSGGGADTTAASRTITSVTATSTGATVTGVAVTAGGRPVDVTVTVIDRPGSRDRITARIGDVTLDGTLVNGEITIG